MALVARAIESVPSAVPMRMTRLTLDLARAVPMGPTDVHVRVTRDGRRVQTIDAEVVVDGERRVGATALRVRVDDDIVSGFEHVVDSAGGAAVATPPNGMPHPSPLWNEGVLSTLDARWEDVSPGAARGWVRPGNPLVEGEPLSPTTRVALAADLILSGGGILPQDDYAVVNADLTLALLRPPRSEWLHLASRVELAADGTGQSHGVISDQHGRIGRAVKSLLVDRRG
jgi:acyl-CoA thioesterase